MRNFSKNKFLLCFRPVVDIDAMLESKVDVHHSTNCGFPCIPISEKHEMIKNSENKPLFSHQASAKFSRSWIMQHSPKRTFSRVIKAVVFKTILNRRARHKNCFVHDSFETKHSYSKFKETKAPQWSLSTSSSHGSVSSSSSPHVSQSQNLQQKESSNGSPLKKEKKFEFYGIYLVLISLVFTVLCGKLFGIILTSIWMYFFSILDLNYHFKKKLLPTCQRENQSLRAKDKGHYGKCA